MPKSIKGWLLFTVSVLVVVFVINNVSFLGNLVARKA